MKKVCLTLAAITFAINFSFAQWNYQSGTSGPIYYAGGAVGIGTLPLSSLNINGGGAVFGTNATVNNTDGALSIGNALIGYAPTTSNWNTTGSTMILTGSGTTTMAFHNYGTGRVEFIKSGNRTIEIGSDGGWGASSVLLPGGIWNYGGQVGIGTTSPQANFHIVGNGNSVDGYSEYSGSGLIIQGNTGTRSATLGAQLEFVIPANTDGTNLWGQARIITVAGNAGNGDATGKMILGTRRYYNKLGTNPQWYYGNDLVIDGAGKIGIGTTSPDQMLTVNGTLHAKQVNVDLSVPAPDYVFEKSYKLKPILAVKNYINAYKHLPEIPSAKTMEQDGVNLTELNMKLLQKVEELTLYLIQQKEESNKQIATQQQQIDKLNKKLEKLIRTQKR